MKRVHAQRELGGGVDMMKSARNGVAAFTNHGDVQSRDGHENSASGRGSPSLLYLLTRKKRTPLANEDLKDFRPPTEEEIQCIRIAFECDDLLGSLEEDEEFARRIFYESDEDHSDEEEDDDDEDDGLGEEWAAYRASLEAEKEAKDSAAKKAAPETPRIVEKTSKEETVTAMSRNISVSSLRINSMLRLNAHSDSRVCSKPFPSAATTELDEIENAFLGNMEDDNVHESQQPFPSQATNASSGYCTQSSAQESADFWDDVDFG